ncbi:MAG: hypothetical protein RLZZ312_1815 [Bacteroidota bacterium]
MKTIAYKYFNRNQDYVLLMKKIVLFFIILNVLSCKKNAFAQAIDAGFASTIDIDTTQIAKYKNKNLVDFYDKYDNKTLWHITDKRLSALQMLQKANNKGLEKEDYAVGILELKEKYIKNLTKKELVDYDLLLSHNLLKYINHLSKGKLDPKQIYKDWDLPIKEINEGEILKVAYDADLINAEIDKCEPKSENYLQLKVALSIIDDLPYDYWRPIYISKKIKLNETNSKIIAIKKRLIYWKDLPTSDTITKIYDKAAQNAMKQFQARHGLYADGVIGTSTIAAMNFNKNERREQIVANLERCRWFPDSFGDHYTVVNIPDYALRIIKNRDTVQTYKIIVGTEKRKSPILTSKLKSVVFCPTWTVPPTIIKEDLVPDATRSRRYFSRMNITIYNYKNEKVTPWEWKPDKATNYRYVQDPGEHNSLGNMKILFNNKYAVYLHDTNHKDGFSRNFRSLSSGCIRVENPLKLAQYVLNDTTNFNDEKVLKIIEARKTVTHNIKQEIQHFQLYYTAWLQNNKLIFRDDIYKLDFDLYCRLRNRF